MRRQVIVPLFVVVMVGCGSSSPGTSTPIVPDGGGIIPNDAAALASPFVPAAVDNTINQLVAAIEAKGLSSSQKPPIAVLLKTFYDFFAPVVIGANRMSTRLGTPTVVEAPFDPNADATAPDALDKAAAAQNVYISSLITDTLYKGMAYSPYEATGDSITTLDAFVNSCGPVVTIDSDIADSKRSYLIATANYQPGVTAAKKLLEVVKPGEAVLVFGTTLAAWVSGIERAQGAIDTLTAAGVIVPPKVSPIWVLETDKQSLITALSDPAYNFTGMACMYSNADSCAAAVEALGKKDLIKIVGFDMGAANKAYFDKGYFYGIAVQRQYYMGQLGALVPYSIETLGPVKTAELVQPILVDGFLLDTGIDIITSDTYASYIAYLSSLGINS